MVGIEPIDQVAGVEIPDHDGRIQEPGEELVEMLPYALGQAALRREQGEGRRELCMTAANRARHEAHPEVCFHEPDDCLHMPREPVPCGPKRELLVQFPQKHLVVTSAHVLLHPPLVPPPARTCATSDVPSGGDFYDESRIVGVHEYVALAADRRRLQVFQLKDWRHFSRRAALSGTAGGIGAKP
jgi:hypothetical protein